MKTRRTFSISGNAQTSALADLGAEFEARYDAYDHMLVEVENEHPDAALADLSLLVKAHDDSDFVTLITAGGWDTPSATGPLEWRTGRADTIAAATAYLASIRVRGPFAFKFQAKSATDQLANGTFTGNANGWTLGAGWAYGTNNVAATAADTTLKQEKANMSAAWTSGQIYAVKFTISGYAAGELIVGTNTDTDQGGDAVVANGTYTRLVTADAHADGLVFTGDGFTGVIDNVSAIPAIPLKIRGTLL